MLQQRLHAQHCRARHHRHDLALIEQLSRGRCGKSRGTVRTAGTWSNETATAACASTSHSPGVCPHLHLPLV